MSKWLAVCAGGALGSGLRYGIALLLARPDSFSYATLLANALGSLLLGVFAFAFQSTETHQELRLLLTTGLCGGFTTYSTFNNETLSMLQRGQWGPAAAYVAGTIGVCLAVGALGYFAAKALNIGL